MSDNYESFGPTMPKAGKQPLTFTGKQKILVVVAGLIIVAVMAAVVASLVLPTEGMKKKDFVSECHDAIKRQLRDPASAQIDEPIFGVQVTDEEEDKYEMSGMARARNGFGGMNSFTYQCTGGYSKEADRVYSIAKLEN